MMRECVRKFDEDLSFKSSKSELEIMQTSLERTFITFDQWGSIEQSIERQRKRVQDDSDKLDTHIEKLMDDQNIKFEQNLKKTIKNNF